jgi:transposase
MTASKKTSPDGFAVTQPHVAGVDIGSREHWVAGPPKADGTPNVRQFRTTSEGLFAIAQWLSEQAVESVAMESTGVYWIPLYELLESRNIKVVLVNARDFSHVPGRPKTDKLDCQWLQRLHSCGLLRGSFRPGAEFVGLRALHRQRANLIHERTRFIQWMQKSLDQMNVQVHHAVSDISGQTGMAIVRAIVAGKRQPEELAALRDPRCQKSAAEIAKHLTGTWKSEHLFNLARALALYDGNEAQVALYDVEIAGRLEQLRKEALAEAVVPTHPKPAKEKELRRAAGLATRTNLYRATGVDLTRIDGIGVDAAQLIVAELGMSADAFPDERHFVSWLRLCPRTKVSGGKALKTSRNGLSANRIAGVLRMAALGASRSKTALGALFRRVSRSKGYTTAIFATARKLAQYVFRALRFGHDYVDIGEKAAEADYEARRLRSLQHEAKARGFALVPIAIS